MEGFPVDTLYDSNEYCLKAQLTAHFQTVIKLENMKETLKDVLIQAVERQKKDRGALDFLKLSSRNKSNSQDDSPSKPESRVHDIVDINFAKKEQNNIYFLNKLNMERNKYL